MQSSSAQVEYLERGLLDVCSESSDGSCEGLDACNRGAQQCGQSLHLLTPITHLHCQTASCLAVARGGGRGGRV